MSLAQQTFKVTANERASASARLIRLDGELKANPGQFAMIWLPSVGEKPFSLAGTSPVEFIIEPVGKFSKALCEIEIGSQLTFRAPLGKGFSFKSEKPVLLGGGCGAAPLFFMARTFAELKIESTTIIGAATEDRLIRNENWPSRVLETTDDGTAGFHGNCVQLLEDLLDKEQFDKIYACGPEPMIMALLQLAEKKDIPIEVSLERYMKCGVGLCGHCAVDPEGWLVCTEGPVADLHKCRCLNELGKYHRNAAGKRVDH